MVGVLNSDVMVLHNYGDSSITSCDGIIYASVGSNVSDA